MFACADGTSSETSSDVARASEPKLKILRVERVLFMSESNQQQIPIARSEGYDMVARRLKVINLRASTTLCGQHS